MASLSDAQIEARRTWWRRVHHDPELNAAADLIAIALAYESVSARYTLGVAGLMRETGFTHRTVIDGLVALEEAGMLLRTAAIGASARQPDAITMLLDD